MMSTKRNGIANKATPSTPPSMAGRRALEEGAVGCVEPTYIYIYTNTLNSSPLLTSAKLFLAIVDYEFANV